MTILGYLILRAFAAILYHWERQDETSRQNTASAVPPALPIPLAPVRNAASRSAALRRIRDSGFHSTTKLTAEDYLIAVDETRCEWTVVTPNGENSQIRPFTQLAGCEIQEDGYPNGLCALEVLVHTTDPASPAIHIVLKDYNSKNSMEQARSLAQEIIRLLRPLCREDTL